MTSRPLACLGAAMALTGCANLFKPPPTEAPLSEVIKHIRQELVTAKNGEAATTLPLTEVTITLKVTTSQKYTSGGGVDLVFDPIKDLKFTTETSGSLENTVQLKWSGSDTTIPLRDKPTTK